MTNYTKIELLNTSRLLFLPEVKVIICLFKFGYRTEQYWLDSVTNGWFKT